MEHKISRREVFNNLIRFKDKLADLKEHGRSLKSKGNQRSYAVLLNRHTGDMRFQQKITTLEQRIVEGKLKKESPLEWKKMQIVVTDWKGKVHFILCDAEQKPLHNSDFSSLALKIATETMELLNHKAVSHEFKEKTMLAEEEVLQDLSMIHLASPTERIEEYPGWIGNITRIDAEKYLKKKARGTYLLREGDQIAVATAFHLAEENVLTVHPFIITFKEEENKITEHLIFQTNRGWTLYKDDPNLKDPHYHYFVSLQGLLNFLKNEIQFPLTMPLKKAS